MKRMPHLDLNHSVIVEALRARSCGVQSLAAIGDGCPDLLVSAFNLNHVLEIKDPTRPILRPAQKLWRTRWRAPVHVVTSIEEALRAVGMSR